MEPTRGTFWSQKNFKTTGDIGSINNINSINLEGEADNRKLPYEIIFIY